MTKIDAFKKFNKELKKAQDYFAGEYMRMLKNGDPFLCDMYHITMGYVWHKTGMDAVHKTSEAFIRKIPLNSSFLITTGQQQILEWIKNWHVTKHHIAYLKSKKGRDGRRLFDDEFLDFFKNMKLEINIDGIAEGDLAFPNEPILSVSGPCWQVEMMEAMILNVINSSSTLTTKANRIVRAAHVDGVERPVLEFALRRCMDIGGLGVARSAYLGGFAGTSNELAAAIFGIPDSGTMAHSFVQSFKTEYDAYNTYITTTNGARIVLVDTTDTYCGIIEAIQASLDNGVPLDGMRIDSGDLVYWHKVARDLLDEAGMKNVQLVASNDLDEASIENMIRSGATYDVIAMGSKLAIPADSAGAVFKTVEFDGRPVMKVVTAKGSEGKRTDPYAKDIIRIINNDGYFGGDILVPKGEVYVENGLLIRDIDSILRNDPYSKSLFPKATKAYSVLKPMVRNGQVISEDIEQPLTQIRANIKSNIAMLDPAYKNLHEPHFYGVGLEKDLFAKREKVLESKLAEIAVRKAKCEQYRANWRAA